MNELYTERRRFLAEAKQKRLKFDIKVGQRTVEDDVYDILGMIEDPEAVDSMIASLKTRDPYVGDERARAAGLRYAAARSLGWIGDPRAIEPLIQALKDAYQVETSRILLEEFTMDKDDYAMYSVSVVYPVRKEAATAMLKISSDPKVHEIAAACQFEVTSQEQKMIRAHIGEEY